MSFNFVVARTHEDPRPDWLRNFNFRFNSTEAFKTTLPGAYHNMFANRILLKWQFLPSTCVICFDLGGGPVSLIDFLIPAYTVKTVSMNAAAQEHNLDHLLQCSSNKDYKMIDSRIHLHCGLTPKTGVWESTGCIVAWPVLESRTRLDLLQN